MSDTSPTDLPVDELIQHARQTQLKLLVDSGVHAEILFKFTCERCGQRCTFEEPNQLYEYGDCFQCGHRTKVEKGGYALAVKIGGKTP